MEAIKKIVSESNKRKVMIWTAKIMGIIMIIDDIVEHLFHLFK